jgi:nicotinamidase-related amidase
MTQNNPPIELEPATTAFVVIDMQNDSGNDRLRRH